MTLDDGWRAEEVTAACRALFWVLMSGSMTFFSVGRHLERNAFLAMTELGVGNVDFGYHTMNHPSVAEVSAWTVDDWHRDMDAWRETGLRSGFGGHLVPFARPPGGAFTSAFRLACQTWENGPMLPSGWALDPAAINRGKVPAAGDILLGHARYSDIEYLIRLGMLLSRLCLAPASLAHLWSLHRADELARSEDYGLRHLPWPVPACP
jgi:hypothetical protein